MYFNSIWLQTVKVLKIKVDRIKFFFPLHINMLLIRHEPALSKPNEALRLADVWVSSDTKYPNSERKQNCSWETGCLIAYSMIKY